MAKAKVKKREHLPMARRMMSVDPHLSARIEKVIGDTLPMTWKQWARLNLLAVVELAETSGQQFPIRRPAKEAKSDE